MVRFILAVCIYCIALLPAYGGTDVPGGTIQSQTWRVSGSPYTLKGNVAVPAGQTLTIEAGVEVMFPSTIGQSTLTINGSLKAIGALGDSIRFTGGPIGFVYLENPQRGPLVIAATSQNSELRYVVVDKLGYYEPSVSTKCVIVQSSSCIIDKCVFRNNRGTAVSIENAVTSLTNSLFSNNSNLDVALALNGLSGLSGNNKLKIGLRNESMTVPEAVLVAGNAYYSLLGNITVPANKTLTAQKGTEIQFPSTADASSQLIINGTLRAEGAVNDSIRFTGGDIGSSYQANPQRGPVVIQSGSLNSVLRYVVIDRLGYNSSSDISNCVIVRSASCTIDKCTFSRNMGTALSLENASVPVTNCFFTNNDNLDVAAGPNTLSGLTANTALKIGVRNEPMTVSEAVFVSGNVYYSLMGNITVPAGKTLTIQKGTEIQFPWTADATSQLIINGTLSAAGAPGDSIRFKGGKIGDSYQANPQRGPVTIGTGSQNSVLKYVVIDSLGYNSSSITTPALIIRSASTIVSNCNIRNIFGTGISIQNAVSASVKDNSFSSNKNADIVSDPQPLFNVFNNSNASVYINAGTIGQNTIWPHPGNGSRYVLNGSITVNSGFNLKITAGTTVDFNNNNGNLVVKGSLTANGTASSRIKFVKKAPGTPFGGTISFENTSMGSSLNYVDIDRLGSVTSPAKSAAIELNTAAINIVSLNISNSENNGLTLKSGNVNVLNSSFSNNKVGVLSTAGASVFTQCNFAGNTSFAINNTSAVIADTAAARNCWWGSPSGPKHPSNLSGAGDSISNKVKYAPFNTAVVPALAPDLGISVLLSPKSTCNLGTSEAIKVTISNYSAVNQTGLQVGYIINNNPPVIESASGLLVPAGGSADYVFTQAANLSAIGNYTIKCFIILDVDNVKANDTLTSIITHLAPPVQPAGLTPADNSTGVNKPVVFSWANAAGAPVYDLYVWPALKEVPATATITGLTQPGYSYNDTSLHYGDTYKWKVKASKDGCSAESAVQQFIIKNLPDLSVKSVTSARASLSPEDTVTVYWNVSNDGKAQSLINWTERIYIQSPVGQNQTLVKQIPFANNNKLDTGQSISRSTVVTIPAQLNNGDAGVFVVELIPDASVQELPGAAANNTGVQQTGWTIKKLLTLELSSATITEGATDGIIATVSRSGSLTTSLPVNITLNNADRFSFPLVVTIPAGQAGATFTIAAPDNNNIEGVIPDTIQVSAPAFQGAKTSISLLDNDKANLSVTNLPVQATEGDLITFRIATNLVQAAPLQVFLHSSAQARFPLPASVTIPAGSLSTDMTVKVAQNNIPEVDVAIILNAGASGHTPANATIQVKDDDLPNLQLVLKTNIIPESAGQFATQATLRRTVSSNMPAFTANLSSGLSNTLILPASISLAAGENETTFTVGVMDNGLVDGDRQVAITASIFVASCGCSAPPATSGSVSASVTVTDDDGPALKLTTTQLTFPEGVANAGILRITRNTNTSGGLNLNLSSSNTAEATLPATAVIPAGQAYVDVPITTINDGIADGNQQLYLQASAGGFSSGSIWIVVTDLNKPDLEIPAVTLGNDSIRASSIFNYQLAVKNSGMATAPAGVIVRGYLSKDDIINSSDSLISTDTLSKAIPAGQTVQVLNAVRMPDLPGNYKLIFKVNPDAALTELLYSNNAAQPVNIVIKPDFIATATVTPLSFTKGVAVPVTGQATKGDGTAAANKQVEIYIITNGLRRSVAAATNAAGDFTAKFVPLANEVGHYTAGACFPGLGDTTAQDAFDILGVRINGGAAPQFKVMLSDTLKGSLTVQNMSSKSLTNFSLIPTTLPSGALVHFDTVSTLAGNATINLPYRITGSVLSAGRNFEVANLQAKDQEGIIQEMNIYYYCQAQNAYVVTDIPKIDITASKAKGERQVEFRLINKGLGNTGFISVNLPQVNWISNVTPKTLPSMGAGDTATIVLKFLASADVPFNYPVTGSVGISAQNGNVFNLPFTFTKVSDSTGAAKIIVTDQFTYYGDRGPKVANAHVVVKDYYNGILYDDGYTDSSGVFLSTNLPEGTHRITVEKDKHLSYYGTISVNAGDTVVSTVFINYQAITFSWTVVPTAIQDQYDVTLTSVFETNVPMPVVTIDMPATMPALSGTQVYPFYVTLTNHGLIKANDVTLTLPDDPEYEFVTNYVQADLGAQQSIQVPVIMRRRATANPGGRVSSATDIAGSMGIRTSQISAESSTSLNCKSYPEVLWWYTCSLTTGLWEHNKKEIKFEGRGCNRNPIPPGPGSPDTFSRVLPIPPRPGPPGTLCFDCPPQCFDCSPACLICPDICADCSSQPVLPSPKLPNIPPVEHPKKGCIQCINAVIGAIAGCLPGRTAAIVSTTSCVFGVWLENDPTDPSGLVGCLPSDRPPAVDCLLGIVDAIAICAETEVDPNIHVYRTQSPSGVPLGSAFQEIANNLRIVLNAYTARENWAKEYFGDILFSDAWTNLQPLIEPYIVGLDSIRPNVQASVLAAMEGYEIPASSLSAFFIKWNTSIYAKRLNILVPDAQYPDIINWIKVKSYSDSMVHSTKIAISKGYASVYDMYQKEYKALNEIIDNQKNAVCASVTVQFSQQLTMTREAFDGTLNIFNGHPTDKMDSITVNILITDSSGNPSNGVFEIQTVKLDSIANVTGTGSINAQQTGIVKFLFIPEIAAAPTAPVLYNFGGSVRYWDPYAKAMVTFPLAAVPITVNPGPNLYLHYFMERNILGDDPLTSPDIEPSRPAELAVMVENHGNGSAVNLAISSAQPKIVDNEKGLAINFSLVGSNFQGQPEKFGVTNINFGTIPALQTRVGQWYFTSSLLGKFVSYDANIVHQNSFGNPGLSLVSSVKLHELTKSIREYGSGNDNINDFLVNDIFDINDYPDIIYFSQGKRTARVVPAASGSFSSPVLPPSYTNTLTVTASDTGWNFIRMNDPGNRLYELASVTRNDGQEVPLNNAWLSFVTLPVTRPPVYENKFHFVDRFTSLVPVTYTVVWTPRNFDIPKVDSITVVPDRLTPVQVTNFKVVFNKSIDAATFTFRDLTLTFQGGSNIVDTSSVAITRIDSVSFNVDISKLTTGNGFYAFTVQAAEVSDVYGIKGAAGKQVTWSQSLDVPMVQAFTGIPVSRKARSFDAIHVLFNIPVDLATVTAARFAIFKDSIQQGGAVIIDSVRADHKLFYLSGLSNILTQSGVYEFRVDLPGIQSADHKAGLQPQSVMLTLDNAGPVIVSLIKSDSGGIDLHHYPFIGIAFNEDAVGFNNAAVQLTRNGEVLPLNINQLSNIDFKNWVAGNFGMLTYPEGNYQFTVNMAGITDAAGNPGAGTQQISWTVNRSALIAISNLAITPDRGFSPSDAITSGGTFSIHFNLSNNASQLTISQFDLGGETILSELSSAAAGNITVPVTLVTGGNTGIKVMAKDINGIASTAELLMFDDQAALLAKWLFASGQIITTQVDTVRVLFSSKLLSDAGFTGALQFSKNGTQLPTGGLGFAPVNDTVYSIFGLRQSGNTGGNYQLTLNPQQMSKFSSGKEGVLPVSVSWTVQPLNLAPVAKAGNDTIITAPGMFMLNGAASYDPDTDPITYRWIAPAGIVLSDSTSATPAFMVTGTNRGNSYSFLLIVRDGVSFATDVVNIAVSDVPVGVYVSAKAFLQGPYTVSSGLMADSLRTQSLLPLISPYAALGYNTVGAVSSLAITTGVLDITGDTAIVDWVWLELRSSTNAAQVLATRAALMRRNGSIVDLDGTSAVYFDNVTEGNYYIAILHRNHLGVMTASPVFLNNAPAANIDFTNPGTATWGTNAQRNINGAMVMWAGDVNGDKRIRYNGSANDKNTILSKVGLTTANSIPTLYDRADLNLDGKVRFNGAANDKNLILSSVGLTTPNAIITEQIPN